MRFFNNTTAATRKAPMPFDGLGFSMDTVRQTAQGMTPVPHCHDDNQAVSLSAPDYVVQPSGYSLLVTLGREIRGR